MQPKYDRKTDSGQPTQFSRKRRNSLIACLEAGATPLSESCVLRIFDCVVVLWSNFQDLNFMDNSDNFSLRRFWIRGGK